MQCLYRYLDFFAEIENFSQKLKRKLKETQITKIILEKHKPETLVLPDFKTYFRAKYQSSVVPAQDKGTDQWDREGRRSQSALTGQMLAARCQHRTAGKGPSSHPAVLGHIDPTCEETKSTLRLHYINYSSGSLNIKAKTTKF